jgi:hypothetical protein
VLHGRAAGDGDAERVAAEHRLGGRALGVVGGDERLGGGEHVATVAAGAVLGDGDGGGIGADLQPGAFGVERADVDGEGGEAEHGHEQQREDHRGGATLAVEPAGAAGDQPLHRMTPVPVRSTLAPKKPVRNGIG